MLCNRLSRRYTPCRHQCLLGLSILLMCVYVWLTARPVEAWNITRFPDSTCNVATGGMQCQFGGYNVSKLAGMFQTYFIAVEGKDIRESHSPVFSLGLHSRTPSNFPLAMHFVNKTNPENLLSETEQRCTDPLYCTLQTWWPSSSQTRVGVSLDNAVMHYPLTPLGSPFGFFDFIYNETLGIDQYIATQFWNQTVVSAYGINNVPGGVFDVPNCAAPIDFSPSLNNQSFPYECGEFVSGSFGNSTTILPFNVTTVLPMNCARFPMPSTLLTDLLSNVGAHNLRTAWNLELQAANSSLPGVLDFLSPYRQLTNLKEKYPAVFQFLHNSGLQPHARFFPPCNSSTVPTISHYYRIGPTCQLYSIQPFPQWIFRVNITLNFTAGEVKPEWAVKYVGTEDEYYIRASWWLIWNGKNVVIQPEADYGNHPLQKVLEKMIQLRAVKILHRDDSLYRYVGPTAPSGGVVLCGQQPSGSFSILNNPWTDPQWSAKPEEGWLYPVPSPAFLRTGWTDSQWNDGSRAEVTARNFPGPFYYVPQSAFDEFSGLECGKVGSLGPCTNRTYSLGNEWGPLTAFLSMSTYARNSTQRSGYPYSSIYPPGARTKYLPPLQPLWGDDLFPRMWIGSHLDAEIPLGILMRPAGSLRERVSQALRVTMMIQLTDRIVAPRTLPIHRKSATDGSSIQPVKQIYKQVQNGNATQCIVNWFQLSQAWQNGTLGALINSTNVTGFYPSSGSLLGAMHNGYCDPPGFTLPSSVSSARKFLEGYICHDMPGLKISGDELVEFQASVWNQTGSCQNTSPRFLVSHVNTQAARDWWRNAAIYVHQHNITMLKIGTCYPQLHDPDAVPRIVLFDRPPFARDGNINNINNPNNIGEVARLPTLINRTVLPAIECFLEVGVAASAIVSSLTPQQVQKVQSFWPQWDCDPFTDDNCDLKQAAWIAFFFCLGFAAFILLIILIQCVVICVKDKKLKEATAKRNSNDNINQSQSVSK